MVTLLEVISDDILVYIISFLGVVMCESFGETCVRVLRCCHRTYVDSDFDFYVELMNYLVSIQLNFHVYGGFFRSLIGGLMPNDLDIFIKRESDSTRAILHLTSLSIFCPKIKKSWYNIEWNLTHKSVVFNFGGKQKKIDICFCAGNSCSFSFGIYIGNNFDFDVNSLHIFMIDFIRKPYSQFISECKNMNTAIIDLIRKKQCNVNYKMLQYKTNTEKKKTCGSRMRKMVVDHGFEIMNMTDDDLFNEMNEYNNYMKNRSHAKKILMFVICSMNFLVDTFFDDLKEITDEIYMNMRKLIEDEAMATLSKSICKYSADCLEKANNQKNIYHMMYLNLQKLMENEEMTNLIEHQCEYSVGSLEKLNKWTDSYLMVLEHCCNVWSQINGEDICGFLCEIYEDIQWKSYRKMIRQMCTKTMCIQKLEEYVNVNLKKVEKQYFLPRYHSVKKERKITTIVYFFGFERKERRRNDYVKKIKGNNKEKIRSEILKENKRNNILGDKNYHPTKHFRRKELLKSCKDL